MSCHCISLHAPSLLSLGQPRLLGCSPALKRSHSDSLDRDVLQLMDQDENKENVSVLHVLTEQWLGTGWAASGSRGGRGRQALRVVPVGGRSSVLWAVVGMQ